LEDLRYRFRAEVLHEFVKQMGVSEDIAVDLCGLIGYQDKHQLGKVPCQHGVKITLAIEEVE
jgi:hypothetical protein